MKWFDIIFFRTLGVGLLLHETILTEDSEWELIVAGLCMFLMPDVINGRTSVAARIIERILGRGE